MRFKFRLGLMAYCVLAYCVLACAAIEGVSAQQKYAVVVGVETYDTSIFKNLRYAKEDAEAIGLALTRLGFDVSLMTSEAGTTALKPNSPKKILTAIRNKAKGLRPHDTFVVTLSGHGIQFVDDKAVDGVKEHYFCPEDADPADVGTLVKFSDVSAIFEQCKATRKLLIVDACRNEILSKAADKSGATKLIDLGSVFENDRTSPEGTYTMFSCSSGERSWEHEDLEHGVFSNYVIEYLSGNAPVSLYDNGQMHLDGLLYHARNKTKRFVEDEIGSKSQTPVLRGSSDAASWKLGSLWFENSVGMKFALIPEGEFMMGSKDSLEDILKEFPGEGTAWHAASFPQHKVRISKPFYLGTHEVTVGQFRRFVEETGYETGVERGQDRKNPLPVGTHDKAVSWFDSGHPKVTDFYPVTVVSWEDAQAFCKWLSRKEGRKVRLPTQAEWEYACRAGSKSRFFFGEDFELLARYANVPNRSGKHRVDVSIPGGDGPATLSVIFGRTIEKVTFKGGRDRSVFTQYETNEHDNVLRTVTIVNESDFPTLEIATEKNQVVLAQNQMVEVTPIEIQQAFDSEFDFYSESDGGKADWMSTGGVPQGSYIVFYRSEGRWKRYSIFSVPKMLGMNQVEVVNGDGDNTLHVRSGTTAHQIAPGGSLTLAGKQHRFTDFINSSDGYIGRLAPVGQFEPNAFGLFDTHGNVWEWCQDGYDLDYSKRQSLDPKGSRFTDTYAIRGACYI